MIELTLADVAQAVFGTLVDADPAAAVTGLVIDSRRVTPGDLFVAIPGEQVDGHEFAAAAFSAGAVAVLCQRPVGGPAILVDDPVVAVGQIASEVLRRLPDLTVVAVTGSSGKTSTKDLLGQVLSAVGGPTVAAWGSFNNELGLPLTVLECDRDTRYLVLEMGARGIGHIAYLCGIAPPQVGVALNVGSAHVGEFGGQQQIALAKSEIVAGLPADGLAVLNADDPLVRAMAAVTAAPVLTFGESPDADVRITGLTLDELARPAFTLSYADAQAHVQLRLSGAHMASNAAAAAAVALGLGLDVTAVVDALSQAEARSQWRMDVQRTPGGVTVINDAYNANPESVKAALQALVAIAGERRSWAILGEMRELGDEALSAHDEVGRLAVRLNVGRLVAVGEPARPIHLGAAQEGSWGNESAWVPDVDAAQALLDAELRSGDVVLVKASRAVGLELLAEHLLAGSGDTG